MNRSKSVYCKRTLIGNWNEDRLKEEFEFKVFLRKRERRELLLQRSRTLFSTLLKEKPMAMSGSLMRFSFNVQIVAPDMPPGPASNKGLVMSTLVTTKQVDYLQNISAGCNITMSKILTPCSRNTFRMINPSDENYVGNVNYGDHFFIRAENYGDPTAPYLYLSYVRGALPDEPDRMPFILTDNPNPSCRFAALPFERNQSVKLIGNPVPTSKRVLVLNCISDLCLCVMNQRWMQTFFGPECGLTCRDLKNLHGQYCAENSFMLISDIKEKKQGVKEHE